MSTVNWASIRDPWGVHGAPALLNHMGIEELKVEGAEPLTWEYAGYEVKVNGGGLLSLLPAEPPRSLLVEVGELDLGQAFEESFLEFLRDEGREGIVNPFSWTLRSPIVTERTGYGQCYSLRSGFASLLELESLRGVAASRCLEVKGARGRQRLYLGAFWLELEGVQMGQAFLSESRELVSVGNRSKVLLVPQGETGIRVGHGYRDYFVSVLQAVAFYEFFVTEGSFRTNAAVIRGPRGSLAISSPVGVEIIARRGEVELAFSGKTLLSAGGALESFKNLLELSVNWEPRRVPSKPLGHMRSYSSTAMLVKARENRVWIALENPTERDGAVELRSHYPLSRVTLETPRDRLEMPSAREIASFPVPRAFVGRAEVELRPLLRMG
ncbi:MAG: hypothetical protein ABDH61_03730 [Acidilobaceae archaeon]